MAQVRSVGAKGALQVKMKIFRSHAGYTPFKYQRRGDVIIDQDVEWATSTPTTAQRAHRRYFVVVVRSA